MTSRLACPNCGAVPKLANDVPPRKIRCRKCETIYRVPADDEEPAPPRRRKSPARSNALVWVLAGAATLVLMLVVGIAAVVGAFWFLREPAKIARGAEAQAEGPIPQKGQPLVVERPKGDGPRGLFVAPGEAPEGKAPVVPGQVGTQVGMTAPEIDGEDIDGQRFKLSDYRGNVVLLDFWGHW